MQKLKVWQFDHDGQVIYGDTDSIMIHTGLDDLAAAKNIAVKVIKEVQVLPLQQCDSFVIQHAEISDTYV
jgi:hypothetical protein